jgi:hypothetical protein
MIFYLLSFSAALRSEEEECRPGFATALVLDFFALPGQKKYPPSGNRPEPISGIS